MMLLVTGGSGVLGTAFHPIAEAAGHSLRVPGHTDLDLFDPVAVKTAMQGVDAVLHLATRIRSLDDMNDPTAWRENDRLRTEASAILVDAALAADVEAFVQPTVTFVYPSDVPADEDTPIGAVAPTLRSALAAERETARFAEAGRRGVVLRFGLLDGPGTGNDAPNLALGATCHVEDAGRALLAAVTAPSGIYNVCRDNERVGNGRFFRATGWTPVL